MDTIQAIARFIAERFNPERIVLFGSHARGIAGRNSDVDLLVETGDEALTRDPGNPIHRAVLERFLVPLDIVICTPESVRRDCHKWYSVVGQALRYGVTLYERRAADAQRRIDAAAWFRNARHDLQVARQLLIEPLLPDMACYHAQQATEKSLKGYLVDRGVHCNFVHDLLYLTRLCVPMAPEFEQFFEQAEIVNVWALRSRYPVDETIEPGFSDAKVAVAFAERVAEAVQARLA